MKKVVVAGYSTTESISLEPPPTYVDVTDANMSVDNKVVVLSIGVAITGGVDSAGNVYTGAGTLTGSAQYNTENGVALILEGDSVDVSCAVVNASGTPLPDPVNVNCKISDAGQSSVTAD